MKRTRDFIWALLMFIAVMLMLTGYIILLRAASEEAIMCGVR